MKEAMDFGRLKHYFDKRTGTVDNKQSKALEQVEKVNKRPKCAFEMSR